MRRMKTPHFSCCLLGPVHTAEVYVGHSADADPHGEAGPGQGQGQASHQQQVHERNYRNGPAGTNPCRGVAKRGDTAMMHSYMCDD